MWEVETGKELAKIGGALSGFASPALSGDDGRLAVGLDDGTVALWNMTGSKPQEVAKLKAGEDMPRLARPTWTCAAQQRGCCGDCWAKSCANSACSARRGH